MWEADDKNGEGEFLYANGDKYVGHWRNGYRNGHGTYTYYNGDVYEGTWKDDKK